MKIKIPFTGKTLYLGRDEVKAIKQRLGYGFYQNTFAEYAMNGGFRVGFDTLYMLYNQLVDVRRAITRISKAVAKEGYKFIDPNNPSKEGNLTEAEKVKMLLDSVQYPFARLKADWVRERHVAGNFYLQLEKNLAGQVIALRNIDPRTMSIVADKYGTVIKYIQRVAGQEPITFNPDEIIHWRLDTSTQNALLGVSPIEAIVLDGQAEIAAQSSNLVFYENNSVPAHLMIVEEDLSKEQYEELQKTIEQKYKGTKNAFKSGIIPFVKDIKTITPSQKDMQFIESRKFTTKKIVVAFGVDAFLLGYTDDTKYSNAAIIYKAFYEDTIRPEEVEFEDMVNKHLLPKLGITGIKFVIELSNYEDEKAVAEMTRADVLAGILTINEARAQRGLEPSENELANELMFNGFIIDDLGDEVKAIKDVVEKKKKLYEKNLNNLLDV